MSFSCRHRDGQRMPRYLPRLLLTLILACHTAWAGETVRLAATSSVYASGLLEHLLRAFEADTGITVETRIGGSGAALRLAQGGRVDLILVHSPDDENRFVAQGDGIERIPLMHNDFLIVGPEDDPAAVAGSRDVSEAMARIRQHGALFLSRGDDSGTHRREMAAWGLAGIDPYGQPWYHEMGMTIGDVLRASSEQQGYTVADRGSWLALRAKLRLRQVFSGDPRLRNTYSVIAVNPALHPTVNAAGAQRLIAWLRGPRGAGLIAGFSLEGETVYAAEPASVPLQAPRGQRAP